MKVIILICFLFAICLAQTNINIYNNGGSGSCGSNQPPTTTPTTTTPTPTCPRQRFGVYNPFYNGPFDRVINGTRSGFIYEMWAEVRRRNPIFPDYISTASVTGSIKEDMLDYLLSGRQDLLLEPFGVTPENSALGLKFSINPFPFVSETDRYLYSNLPTTATQSSGSCKGLPACFAGGWCSNYDYQRIADFSNNNGNVPVVITYNLGSTRLNDAQVMKQQLTSRGVRNVTLNGIAATNFYVDMFNYAVKISSISPFSQINFIHSAPAIALQQCMNFPVGTKLSVVTLSFPNFQSGFALNPNVDTFYLDAFNEVLKQFINDRYLCKLGVKYRGYCNDQSNTFWTNSQNYCAKVNWPDLPECSK